MGVLVLRDDGGDQPIGTRSPPDNVFEDAVPSDEVGDLPAELRVERYTIVEHRHAESVRDSLRDDGIYRFWHQSFKVFLIQAETQRIADALQAVDPARPLHPWFLQIVADGTGREFGGRDTNQNWAAHTRPIVEAWFHAEHLLSAAIQSAEELDDATPSLPYPWATVLCLYQMR